MSANVPQHCDSPDSDAPASDEVRVRRAATRARYDTETVHAIVDRSLVAHVATVRDGLPVVVPMFCVRDGERLLLHGAPATGTIRRSSGGIDVCATITLLDAVVLARSSFHHSMNYRSVVIIGEATEITEPRDKAAALETLVERLVPGRQSQLRPTTDKEHRGTAVLALPLDRASAKIRTGPPVDDEPDYDLDIWAGVVPLQTTFGDPAPDPRLPDHVALPDNVAAMAGRVL